MSRNELSKISNITPNIYLSGIYPLESNPEQVNRLGIKYILSCVDRQYISEVHDKIMIDSPDTTILYLPYDDDLCQNLWTINQNLVNLLKYSSNTNDFNHTKNLLNVYQNKPMIEIGYHFMDNVINSGGKVLVHCMAGVSRSVSLITYYLMKKNCLGFYDALAFIKSQRPIVNPNESFKNQLKNYEIKRDQFKHSDAQALTKCDL